MAPVHRRMRAVFFGVALLLATAAGRVAADGSSSVDHAAKHGGNKGDKHCSSLSDDCGFVTATDLQATEGGAIFTLTTDGAGNPTCVATSTAPGSSGECAYNAATQTLELVSNCPDGYSVSTTTCAPYVDDGQGGTVIDPWATQNVSNVLNDVMFCGMPLEPPLPADSTFEYLLIARCEPDFGFAGDNTSDDDSAAAKKTLMPKADKMKKGLAANFIAATKKN